MKANIIIYSMLKLILDFYFEQIWFDYNTGFYYCCPKYLPVKNTNGFY